MINQNEWSHKLFIPWQVWTLPRQTAWYWRRVGKRGKIQREKAWGLWGGWGESMEVKVCSPGAGCVEKEPSLYAAGCEEGVVIGWRWSERRREVGQREEVERRWEWGERGDKRRQCRGRKGELIKQTDSLMGKHYYFLHQLLFFFFCPLVDWNPTELEEWALTGLRARLPKRNSARGNHTVVLGSHAS